MSGDPAEIVRLDEDTPRPTTADDLIAQSDLTAADVDAADALAREAARRGARTSAEAARLAAALAPAVTLYDYQKDIVTNARRFIAMMICRQGGKTFASTLRVARKLLAGPLPYYILSRSERQSANAIAQLATHLRALERALAARGKRLAGAGAAPKWTQQRLRFTRADGSGAEYTRLAVALPNGSRGVGLPASPDTVVGISGCVYGDEFALHRDSREVFGRLFPVISRRREYEMILTSTPRGLGNKFHEIMTSPDYAEIFHRMVVPIAEAVRQGLRLFDYNGDAVTDEAGIERLRKALKDDETWREEYLCEFVDDVSQLLSYELIGRCERLHLPDGAPYTVAELPADFVPGRDSLARLMAGRLGTGELFLGFDQARHRDLSVIWIDEAAGRESWARAILVMRNWDYERQEATLWQAMELPNVRLAAIDATGLGERTAERTVTRYGMKAVAVNFSSRVVDRRGVTHPAKAILARSILERHQDGLDRYPVMDLIRDDFHKVKRKRGASPDTFSYFADDDATGHADVFTAKALADYCAQELREYSGRVDGLRIAAAPTLRSRGLPMRAEDARDDGATGDTADRGMGVLVA